MDDATLHGCIPVIIMVGGDGFGWRRGGDVRAGFGATQSCWLGVSSLSGQPGAVPGLQRMAPGFECCCDPVCCCAVLQDNVDVSFESIIDLSKFSLRIPQADVERLPELLLAVPEERRQEMRRHLALVWQKFAYSSYRPYVKRFREVQKENLRLQREAAAELAAADGGGGSGGGSGGSSGSEPDASLPATVEDLDPAADDAFGTIMAWLYSRIEATR